MGMIGQRKNSLSSVNCRYNESMKLNFFCSVFIIFFACVGYGDFQKGTAIRDAEIEKTLKNYLDPLFTTAGLNPEDSNIVIIIDPAMNAAALPNNTMLFFTGFLIGTQTPEEVAGVLAHEVGHIAARHLVRMYSAIDKAQKMSMLGALMGIAVGMLGSPDAGMAIAMGSSSQALHSFLHYRRSEEEVADMLAVKYLEALKWPIRGLRTFLSKLLGQELLSESLQDPYLRSHPLTKDRVERIRSKEDAGGTHYEGKMPPYFQEQHNRMVAKLKAFLWSTNRTLQTFTGNAIVDLYARSIAYYRQKDFEKALKILEELIEKEPKNPFFYEFRGQILFEAGRIAESIPPYQKAVDLLPESTLLQVGLAQSLLQGDDLKAIEKAVCLLKKATHNEKDNGMAWNYLAIAYGKQNKMGLMAIALAEKGFVTREWRYALDQANRAKNFSKKGSQIYQRAEEIEREAQEASKREKESPLPHH